MSSTEVIPKQFLYELTSARRLDELLSSTPTSTGSELEITGSDPMCPDEMINMNFNCATHNTSPYTIRLEVVNPGNTEANFEFKFPADFRMDLEGWAQHSSLSQDQYEILKIEENKLFRINPRRARLKSGERVVIKMSYSHRLVGSHSFPVILSISGGREIPLRLTGITLGAEDKYLNFPFAHHELKPVKLGLLQAPIQQINFYNGSSNKIHYEVDLEQIRKINSENWDWQIFKIQNPKGLVQPGSCGEIQVQFSPLEPKEYAVELKVKIIGGQDQCLRIKGTGDSGYSDSPAFLNNKSKIDESGALCSLSLDRIQLGS